jgi:drug/metabolite transporter (DMT)-like permease
MNSPFSYRLMLLCSALLFSTGGTAIKATPFNGWQVASMRSAIAALVLFQLLPRGRRWWKPRVLAIGALQAATMILFALANKFTTAANVIFLQYTAPLHLLWIGPWLLKERPRRGDLMFMAVLIGGVCLLLAGQEPGRATARHPVAGNILAIVSGLTWALTIAGLRWHAHRAGPSGDDDAGACIIAGNVIAALFCLPFALPLPPEGASAWAPVVFLGVFQIALAYFCFTRGVSRVSALEASLILFMEPVGSAAWAWLIHGERLTFMALTGCLVMLAATASHSLWRMRDRAVSTAEADLPPGS